MSVDVIIVNWNGGAELLDAIASGQRFGANVIVVDNGSTRGTISALNSVPDIALVRNPTNIGFGRACNIGAAHGRAELIMLLNPDARIVSGSTADLERAFAKSGAMLMGVRLEQAPGKPVPSGYALPHAVDLVVDLLRLKAIGKRVGATQPPRPVVPPKSRASWIVGAALAMRRTDWVRLRGMDDGYFLWYEDVDLGAKVHEAGGSVAIAEGLLVRHSGASTWKRLPRRRRQWLRVCGASRYARKHLSPGAAAAVIAAAPFALAIGVALDTALWLVRLAVRR